MLKGGRPAKAVLEHFVKVESNGKQFLDASSVVTICHPTVIECWFITPSAVTVKVLCYNYTTMDIRNNKYKVPMFSLNFLLTIARVHCI